VGREASTKYSNCHCEADIMMMLQNIKIEFDTFMKVMPLHLWELGNYAISN
jgi:hypothetical protein